MHKFEKNLGLIFTVCLLLVLAGFFALKIFSSNVKGAVARSYKVVVWDDNARMLVDSESLEPEKVLASNNIKTWPEDIIETSLILDPVTDGGAGQKIVIKRAPVYTVNVDGGTQTIRSWGKTVGEVLKDKIVLGPKDTIEPASEALAVPQEIVITRINIVDLDENAVIPFGTTNQNDFYTPQGVNKTVTAGVNGEKIRHLKVTYKNGIEVGRALLSETVTKAPITQVVKKGLMPSSDPDFKRQYWDIMVAAGTKYSISPLALFEVASCESHVNPLSQGAYYGMYQYSSGFWNQASAAAGYAGAAWSDATAQIYTTAYWASKYGWGRWGCKP